MFFDILCKRTTCLSIKDYLKFFLVNHSAIIFFQADRSIVMFQKVLQGLN